MRRSPRDLRRTHGDSGVTLVETLVAMGVFAVLLTIVMSSVVSVMHGAVRSQNTADTASDVGRVFTTLDRQVRYADAVNSAGTTGTSPAATHWVEFRTRPLTGAVKQCTQWQYVQATGELRTRQWPEGAAASTVAWRTILVTTAGASQGQPFTMRRTDSDNIMQRLEISLRSSRPAEGSAQLRSTFVARNSTASSAGNADANGDGVSDSPVCAPADYRS
jgi:prepilin-type N-terminal cleavage/methylation domain-containing protein